MSRSGIRLQKPVNDARQRRNLHGAGSRARRSRRVSSRLRPAPFSGEIHGYLETFEGEGSNWSFVRPVAPGSTRVAETSEKRPISRFCCTGLYQFARTGRFRAAFEAEARRPAAALEGGELYVAPLYNRLLAEGADIRFTLVPRSAVHFCGVPDEYDAIRAAPPIYRD